MPTSALSARIVQSFVQRIYAAPEDVFPLLCPELEKHWLPGWDYRMIHSASGVAERGAVFETTHALGTTTWIVTHHESPRRVAFARWQPDGVVVHIEITLGRHVDGVTAVCIEYTSTPTNESSRAILAASSEKDWLDSMAKWEGSMNAWFEKRPRTALKR
ncbi:MAG TPA: hypothetical protein VM146_08915 [Steroidobacteraceae bacterium]|nr:hypothetical protein [Steroidobacteraceae bacterium]